MAEIVVDESKIADLRSIPDGWFLWSLSHMHTSIVYRGDEHTPVQWTAHLQKLLSGGKLTKGFGQTATAAIMDAAAKVLLRP